MNLKKIRIEKKLTQQQVAEMAGITQSTYSRLENGVGVPTPETCKKIAAVLGFDWWELFEDDEGEENEERT